MSKVDRPNANEEFHLPELRGEGVKISKEAMRKASEKHAQKPPHKRSRVPRGFKSAQSAAPLADTGT